MGEVVGGNYVSSYSGDQIDELLGKVNAGVSPLVGKGINLLDNWYFLNPINQRGQTTYSSGYFGIDRWKRATSAVQCSVVANGYKVEQMTSGTAARICQEVENAAQYGGNTVTFSALISEKSAIATKIFYYYEVGGTGYYEGGAAATAAGLISSTLALPAGITVLRLFIDGSDTREGDSVGDYTTFAAVKLELGDTQTLAREVNGSWVLNDPPPNFAEELAKCQRYLLVLSSPDGTAGSAGTGVAISTTKALMSIPIPVSMRKGTSNPTVTFSGNIYLYHGAATGSSTPKVTAITDPRVGNNVITLAAEIGSAALTGGEFCTMMFRDTTAKLIISEEL